MLTKLPSPFVDAVPPSGVSVPQRAPESAVTDERGNGHMASGKRRAADSCSSAALNDTSRSNFVNGFLAASGLLEPLPHVMNTIALAFLAAGGGHKVKIPLRQALQLSRA